VTGPVIGGAGWLPDPRDPMNCYTPGSLYWTTTNAGEAMPGVQTPLSITAYQSFGSAGCERTGRAMGIFTEASGLPAPAIMPIHGRACMSVDFLRVVADRMPGASGDQIVTGLLGHVPDGLTFSPTRRYYLRVLRTFPRSFARIPSELAAITKDQDAWWLRRIPEFGSLDESAALRAFTESVQRLRQAGISQCVAVVCGVQPVHDALERVIQKLGVEGSSTLIAPVGGAEMEVVCDIWRASRGEISVADVVGRHGFHGPLEGEASSRVWREDDTSLRRIIQQYAQRPETESPLRAESRRIRERAVAERELLAATPVLARTAVRALLGLARQRLHLRGAAKRSLLQGLDGVRASARRLGELLAARGELADPDDIFYLTIDEVARPLPVDLADLIAHRRERREYYLRHMLPNDFSGVPSPIPVGGQRTATRSEITGVGVSGGRVEGVARVVNDPSFVEVEPGEVLVAPTTDPSWASIMFISSALVVDIGGALSHAAVVARELGIPCVVNTRDGTRAIRTGDRVRVDGTTGIVEIIGS
jgi:phosphohistidine swiveling domain-containing protein